VTTSVIIPTWRRPEQLRTTLERILACVPRPSEILIHVDAGDDETPAMLSKSFANRTQWIVADQTQGPGGGRNRLAQLAQGLLLVSLDDDSWPEDVDFFTRVERHAAENPQAAVFAAVVSLPEHDTTSSRKMMRAVSCFENCGAVLRRDAFLATSGFLPLRHAYGMEEADISLQLLDEGWEILSSPELRVFHDSKLAHHSSPEVNSAHIRNIGLLTYLRYPVSYWPLGFAQVINRVRYAISTHRLSGIFRGMISIVGICWQYRDLRNPVKMSTLRKSRQLR